MCNAALSYVIVHTHASGLSAIFLVNVDQTVASLMSTVGITTCTLSLLYPFPYAQGIECCTIYIGCHHTGYSLEEQ